MLMRILRLGILVCVCRRCGCVHGYGGCLFMAPFKHTLTGRVHFRSFPMPDGIDEVPILALDHTAYLYSPAQSFSCLAADELQLVGDLGVSAEHRREFARQRQGTLFGAASSHEHTRFLMNVITLLPDNSRSLAR